MMRLLLLFLVFALSAGAQPVVDPSPTDYPDLHPEDTYQTVVRPLFYGPTLARPCAVGALTHGMRFRPTNDPVGRQWLVLDRNAVMTDWPSPPTGTENWILPVGRECVALDDGRVHVWSWDEEVIRTR